MENQKQYEQSFYVVIPTWLWDNDKLPWKLKKLYGRIVSLCKKEGYCWASNRYFADELKISISTAKRYLQKLKKLEVIDYEVLRDEATQEVQARKIWIEKMPPRVKDEPTSGQFIGENEPTSGQFIGENEPSSSNSDINRELLAGAKAPGGSSLDELSKLSGERIARGTSRYNPKVSEVVNFFLAACKNIKGFEPATTKKAEEPLVKERLRKYSVDDITEELDWFLKDPISDRLSCSLKVALSASVWNKWLSQRETYEP